MARRPPDEDAYRAIINQIAQRRFDRGLKQSDLAALIGLTQDAVSRIETCARQLSLMEFKRACEVLELDAGELLRGATSSR